MLELKKLRKGRHVPVDGNGFYVELFCKKAGISRATAYRWEKNKMLIPVRDYLNRRVYTDADVEKAKALTSNRWDGDGVLKK